MLCSCKHLARPAPHALVDDKSICTADSEYHDARDAWSVGDPGTSLLGAGQPQSHSTVHSDAIHSTSACTHSLQQQRGWHRWQLGPALHTSDSDTASACALPACRPLASQLGSDLPQGKQLDRACECAVHASVFCVPAGPTAACAHAWQAAVPAGSVMPAHAFLRALPLPPAGCTPVGVPFHTQQHPACKTRLPPGTKP